ncbi:hypothetical protein D9M69_415890 [compost metagenome]
MGVGQFVELGATTAQVIGGAALGDHQREHLAQRQAALGEVGGLHQGGVDLLEVGAVPDAQAVGQTVDLAMARRGGQRHAVQVVADDAAPRLEGLRPLLVGAHAGGGHLPEFFPRRAGAAFRRMAVFLQLGGQGAAAGGLAVEVEVLADLGPGGHHEARPVHRRVGLRRFGVEQVAVLDEQQAVDHQRRDAGEVRVELLRIAEAI